MEITQRVKGVSQRDIENFRPVHVEFPITAPMVYRGNLAGLIKRLGAEEFETPAARLYKNAVRISRSI